MRPAVFPVPKLLRPHGVHLVTQRNGNHLGPAAHVPLINAAAGQTGRPRRDLTVQLHQRIEAEIGRLQDAETLGPDQELQHVVHAA